MHEVTNSDERMWGTLCHLAAFAALLGVPFGNVLGPLLVWLLKRQQYPFVDDQGKEAVNFQISLVVYGFVAAALAIPLMILGMVTPGFMLAPALLIGLVVVGILVAGLFLVVVGAVRANNGGWFRYPFTIRFIK